MDGLAVMLGLLIGARWIADAIRSLAADHLGGADGG